ncbi:Cyclic pyranopterin phosphate synthase (MoaA) [hydrothermal vent metagenome]|uniref:GTP 3',8-cyclase n=1 Tax=hydrothermal vent metagenome TaxID=652676 RepID=A0A3B0SNN8_9ZZZZ
MRDAYGRSFAYLRLSVTDVCNFSCQYCLPDGFRKKPGPGFLSLNEIRRLASAFAALGLWKIRITGGEPTVRKDFTQIIETLRAVPGVKTLATTTNGYRLRDNAQTWRDAGLDAINISVDSFDAKTFHQLTGHDRLPEVLQGVEACLDAKFASVKLNAVLLKGVNDHDLASYLDFVQDRPISIRFIELMRTGDNADYFHKHHLPASQVSDQLRAQDWVQKTREPGAGPAIEFVHPNYAGRIGLIAPYSKDFCTSCNRLRVSARGNLHLCLFSENGISLRDLLQSDAEQTQLMQFIQQQLQQKSASHFLHQGNSGGTQKLADIGG